MVLTAVPPSSSVRPVPGRRRWVCALLSERAASLRHVFEGFCDWGRKEGWIVDRYDGTALSAEALASFADALVAAGYEGSAVLDSDPDYQLLVGLPVAGFSEDATPTRFAWDFSEAPSILDIAAALNANEDTAPAATALVTGLSFDARVTGGSTVVLIR